jgi:hypothetical protein
LIDSLNSRYSAAVMEDSFLRFESPFEFGLLYQPAADPAGTAQFQDSAISQLTPVWACETLHQVEVLVN